MKDITQNIGQQSTMRQSLVIDAMRPLLMTLVVFIHLLPNRYLPVTADFSADGLYVILSELISHNIGRIAVPAFFVISGYYFFAGLGDRTANLDWFLGKWKKRLRTLVLPYVIWNLLLVACIIVKNSVFSHLGLGEDDFIGQVRSLGVYGTMWGFPMNFPLWYLRDLIVMVILSPLFYWFIKKLRRVALALLVLFYLICPSIGVPGLSTEAITFFGIGAYFGIRQLNMLSFCGKYRIASYVLASILIIVSLCCNAEAYHDAAIHFACIPALVAFVNVVNGLRDSTLHTLSRFSSAVFFVYAIHEIYILNWTKGFFMSVFGDSTIGHWATYFLGHIVVLTVCYSLYLLVRKFCPRILSVMTGGRQ